MATFLLTLLILIGYLSGSLCSAIVISRAFSLPDPLTEGSKNPGATNVLRLAGKKYALLVMVFDVLKGVVPVLLAKALGASPLVTALTCLAAVLGHMYPVFFQFKGGKGVATALGALLAFHFILGLAVILTWLLVASLSRYSSLASLISMAFMPFYSLLLFKGFAIFLPLLFITFFIFYKHRQNITRLLNGTESKISFKRVAATLDK